MPRSSQGLHLTLGTLVLVIVLLLASCAPAAAPTPTAAPPSPTAVRPGPSPTPSAPPTPTVQKPTYGGILTVPLTADVPSLDSKGETTVLIGDVNSTVYNSLLTTNVYKEDRPIIPMLAERWELSADGLSYTFYLKKGVKFHNGDDFNAQDVVHTANLYAKPPEGWRSTQVTTYANMVKVEAVDDYTVRFTMKARSAPGINNMGGATVYSKEWLQAGGNPRADMNGTGPFKFKNWTTGSSIELVKNTSYWKSGLPYLDGVTFFPIADAGTRFAALRTGQVKFTSNYFSEITPSENASLTKENSKIITWPNPVMLLPMLVPNVQRKPWDDLRIRKAIDLAIDRYQMVEVVDQGGGMVCGYMTPGRNPAGIPCAELVKRPGWRKDKTADRAEAKRLLAEAGFPNGFQTQLMVRSIPAFKENAVFLSDQLAQIGITAPLDVGEVAVIDGRGRRQEFEIGQWRMPNSSIDPSDAARSWYIPGGSLNFNAWKDQKFIDMFNAQDQEVDPTRRSQIVLQMDEYLFAQLPVVYGSWQFGYYAAWPEVRDFPRFASGGGQDMYSQMWLAK